MVWILLWPPGTWFGLIQCYLLLLQTLPVDANTNAGNVLKIVFQSIDMSGPHTNIALTVETETSG
jgi:hypothetical protein